MAGCRMPSLRSTATDDIDDENIGAVLDALHQRMLRSAGSDPLDWNPIDSSWFKSSAAAVFADELGALLGKPQPGEHCLVSQHARISRLLPLWQTTLQCSGHQTAYLLPLCSPQQVANTQQATLPAWQAQLLWLRHVLDAEAGTRGQPRLLLNISKSDTDPDWTRELATTTAHLGLPRPLELAAEAAPPAGTGSAAAQDQGADDTAAVAGVISGWSQHAWQALQLLCDDEQDGAAIEQLNTVRAAFDAACSLLGDLLHQQQRTAQTLGQRCDRQQSELLRLSTELERGEARIEALSAGDQQLRRQFDASLLRLSALQSSAAWLSAKPVHWLEQRRPGLTRRAVKLARLARSAMTGKLSAQRRQQARTEAILRSGLFDPDYYVKANPDLIINGLEPLAHWLGAGWREQRQPHPLFDTSWYLQRHPTLGDADIDPLSHYLGSDPADRQQPCALFDSRWYLDQYPQAAASGLDPLQHYLQRGAAEGFSPSPLFDHGWYLQQSADVAAVGINPLIHYLAFGAAAGRDPCPLFSSSWYLQRYPVVAAAGSNPLQHFIEHGAEQDFDPGPQFDTGWYRQQHPEIADSGINLLAHYLSIGTREHYLPNPGAQLPLHAEHDAASAILDDSYQLSLLLPVWDQQWSSLPTPPTEPAQRVLVVDEKHPTPDLDSGSFRMRKILDCLLEMGLDVTFAGDQAPVDPRYVTELEAIGIHCLTGRKATLRQLMSRGTEFGSVILSRPAVCERYLPLVRAFAVDATVLYDTVDLHWLRLERGALVADDPEPMLQAADHYRRLELANARSADITIAITDDERELLLQRDAKLQVSVIPNIHDIATDVPPFEQRSGLFFIGSFAHPPNIEAVHYLVSEIMPRLREQLPDVRLHLVGSQMPDEIAALASDQVNPIGYVEDVTACFNESRLFVAPLLHGAGMKGKVGQALSFGLPVVTTSIGAEGIGLRDYHSALISDDPQGIAERIIACYQDPALWQKLSDNGRQVIDEQFSPATVGQRIAGLIQTGDRPQVAP